MKHSAKIGAVKYRVGNSELTEQFFNSVEELQQMLKNLESEDTRDNNIHLVDVLMPFSKIQVKVYMEVYKHCHQKYQQI